MKLVKQHINYKHNCRRALIKLVQNKLNKKINIFKSKKKASALLAGLIITMSSNYYMGYQHESLEKLQFNQAY